jgi:hypothetical protein
LVEHCTENAGVGGSIPPLGTILLRDNALRRIAPPKTAKQDALRSLGEGGLPNALRLPAAE